MTAKEFLAKFGTSEGAVAGWDTRGRGRVPVVRRTMPDLAIHEMDHRSAAARDEVFKASAPYITGGGRAGEAAVMLNASMQDAMRHSDETTTLIARTPKGTFAGLAQFSRVSGELQVHYLAVNPAVLAGKMELHGTGTRMMVEVAEVAKAQCVGVSLKSLDYESDKFYRAIGMAESRTDRVSIRSGLAHFSWSHDEAARFASYSISKSMVSDKLAVRFRVADALLVESQHAPIAGLKLIAEKVDAGQELLKYKFGSTQINIPDSDARRAILALGASIDDDDLAGDGREDQSHITVRYGIKGSDIDGIRDYLSQQQPFLVTLGPIAAFEPSTHSDGAAPLIITVQSPELHRINAELSDAGEFTEPSFEYHPHLTVAYVRPGAVDWYVGSPDIRGSFIVSSIAICTTDGTQEEVKLLGAAKGIAVTGSCVPLYSLRYGLVKYGTSTGVSEAWDTRGRGRKKPDEGRVARAKATYKPCTKAVRAQGDEWQRKLAQIVGGKVTADNSPFDVVKGNIGIEAKACVHQIDPAARINMHVSSRQRKEIDAGKFKRVYCVAIDIRGAKPVYYAKAGIGAFRFSSMTRLTSASALREFLK